MINKSAHNSLDFSVIGNTEDYISLRAYNRQGEALLAKDYAKSIIIEQLLHQYHYQFEDDIAALEIYSAENFDTINYPFSFTPRIQPQAVKMELTDIAPAAYHAQELTTIVKPLVLSASQDYPQWLGEKQQSIRVKNFNISLFLPADKNQPELDAVIAVRNSITPYIQENLTAIKLRLKDHNAQTWYDNYLSFIEKQSIDNNAAPVSYLDASVAITLPGAYFSDNPVLKGQLTFNLPTLLSNKTIAIPKQGELIKLETLTVRLIKLTPQHVHFEIRGHIDQLIQLKLYNKNNQLISEAMEFKDLAEDSAELVLNYSDEIDTLKIIYARQQEKKLIPFSLSRNIH